MAGKRKKTEMPTQPLTLAALGSYGMLKDFSPPAGPFDPTGRFKTAYNICLAGGGARIVRGFLSLERTPAPDGQGISLAVEMAMLQSALTVHHTKATLQCAADTLCTPRSWKLESVLLDSGGKPMDLTRVEETGQVQNGGIEIRPQKEGMRPRHIKVAVAFTSNWSLLEAVQRLPAQGLAPLQFALLEDLDLLKEDHRLLYRGGPMQGIGGDLAVNGRPLPLHEYHQIGSGILPFHYGVDHQRRLLFVASGQRAYIWNPDAQRNFEEMTTRMERRSRDEQQKEE